MNLFYRKPDYVRQEGSVRYLDALHLTRPLSMPRAQLAVMAVFVVVGVIIGVNLYQGTVGNMQQTQQLSQATVEENLSRAVTYDLPVLPGLAGWEDQEILDSFTNAGYTIYNQTEEGSSGLNLIKLPSDVTLADAATLYEGRGFAWRLRCSAPAQRLVELLARPQRRGKLRGEVRRLLGELHRGRHLRGHRQPGLRPRHHA